MFHNFLELGIRVLEYKIEEKAEMMEIKWTRIV
jgi:hypothetical protein